MAFTPDVFKPVSYWKPLSSVSVLSCLWSIGLRYPGQEKNFKMPWQKCLREEKPYPAHVIVIQQYYMI